MRFILAILLGKLILFLSQNLKIGGGSAAPGLYALKIDPDLVEKLAKRIPKNIVITGTNGKTTTTKLLAHFAKASGLKVIRNHTGSNLERGIASTLLNNSSEADLGIWELDEAAFNTVAPKLNPDLIIFLNVFRDQLDRYGEVDSVVKNWCKTLQNMPTGTEVFVNGDDINTLKLASCFKGKVKKFGVKDYKFVGESIEHLKEIEHLDFEATNIRTNGLNGTEFQLKTVTCNLKTNLPLPGIYHIYDFLAAFAVGAGLGFEPKKMISSLKDYNPAFGRVEKLPLPRLGSGKAGFGYIFLIKNPAGATQVFETIAPNIRSNDRLLLALNDNLADGTDVSWIWDAKFEKLLSLSLREAKRRSNLIFISGTRAQDLAVRLKYAGFPIKTVNIEPDLEITLKRSRNGLKGRLFILPTYTAMLELQSILVNMGIKRNYWEVE